MQRRIRFRGAERLEPRQLLAIVGVPWQDARHLTFSFVPDGAPIAAHGSELFATMDALAPRDVWQGEIARALQSWASVTNLDVGLVADGGQALGTPGRVQHDPRFGDLRFAAHAMEPSSLSVSVLHDPFLAGTLAGDVFFNSNTDFAAAGTDLYSVALHEIGHSLGLDHSNDPQSVMFTHAVQMHTGLAPSDVAAIRALYSTSQALYGPRVPDVHDAEEDNGTQDNATELKFSDDPPDPFTGETPVVAYGDITTAADVDYFKLKPIDGYDGPVSFRVQTRGISLFAPRVEVYDEAGVLMPFVAFNEFDDTLGTVVTISVPATNPNATWYLRIEGATDDAFATGRYAVAATFDGENRISAALVDQVLRSPFDALEIDEDDLRKVFEDPTGAFVDEDFYENDEPLTAVPLLTTLGYAPNTHYRTLGSVSMASDIDVYFVPAPQLGSGQSAVVTITVSELDFNGTPAIPQLLDENGNSIETVVLVNDNGTFTVQAANLADDTGYFVSVHGRGPGIHPDTSIVYDISPVGNYELTVSYGTRAAEIETFATGTVNRLRSRQDVMLYVAEDQLFHFLLSATSTSSTTPSGIVARVFNQQGEEVFQMTTLAGGSSSAAPQHLTPGTYRIELYYRAPQGAPGTTVSYSLRGGRLTKPVGPAVEDPTLDPLFDCPDDPDMFCFPGGIISPVPVLFLAFGNRLVPNQPGTQDTWRTIRPVAPSPFGAQEGSPTRVAFTQAFTQTKHEERLSWWFEGY